MTLLPKNRAENLEGPASHGFSISPNDTTDLPQATRAVYVGADGDLAVVMVSGATVSFQALMGGTLLPIRVSKVLATGTTAGALVGLN